MCEACDLRKTYEDENLEASAILLMLLGKIHATVDKDGSMDINMKLNPADSDRLCAWGAAHEDAEESDAAEEDMPLEESENLESDSRIRFGSGEGTAVALHQPTGFGVGNKVLSMIDRDGRPGQGFRNRLASWRYEVNDIYDLPNDFNPTMARGLSR